MLINASPVGLQVRFASGKRSVLKRFREGEATHLSAMMLTPLCEAIVQSHPVTQNSTGLPTLSRRIQTLMLTLRGLQQGQSNRLTALVEEQNLKDKILALPRKDVLMELLWPLQPVVPAGGGSQITPKTFAPKAFDEIVSISKWTQPLRGLVVEPPGDILFPATAIGPIMTSAHLASIGLGDIALSDLCNWAVEQHARHGSAHIPGNKQERKKLFRPILSTAPYRFPSFDNLFRRLAAFGVFRKGSERGSGWDLQTSPERLFQWQLFALPRQPKSVLDMTREAVARDPSQFKALTQHLCQTVVHKARRANRDAFPLVSNAHLREFKAMLAEKVAPQQDATGSVSADKARKLLGLSRRVWHNRLRILSREANGEQMPVTNDLQVRYIRANRQTRLVFSKVASSGSVTTPESSTTTSTV